jgi:mannose-1-phosphate guanylyltransferase
MFVWSIPAILSAFMRHVPELAHFVERLHSAADWLGSMQTMFSTLPKISIDYAIMEKARRVLVVEANFDWDDVGNWPAVAKYLRQTEEGNSTNVALEAIDSENNIVFSDQPGTVALLGVKDLIVVRTGDALLVCHRHDAEKIKHIVAKVPAELQ